MPDDHPEAMTLLCDALHHRLRALHNAPLLDVLDHVAKLVDKYDCSAAMMGTSTAWLHKLSVEAKRADYKVFERLLPVAYLFDNAPAFRDITKDLIYHYRGSFSSFGYKVGNILPVEVFGKDLKSVVHDWKISLNMSLN